MVDGPNLYAYLNNNPLNDTDPWGLCRGIGSVFKFIGDFFFDSSTFSDSRKLFQAASGPGGDLGLQALAVVGVLAITVDTGLNVATFGGKAAAEGAAKKAVTELHHIIPKYLGGNKKGPLIKLTKEYHQKITNAFREAFTYKKGGYREEWGTIQHEQKLEDTIRDVYTKLPLP